jgi:hypothetical protein
MRNVLRNEAGSYLRRIDPCITQPKAQGPSRTCRESKEEEVYLDVSSEGVAVRGVGKAAVDSVSPIWPDQALSSSKRDGFEQQTQHVDLRVVCRQHTSYSR